MKKNPIPKMLRRGGKYSKSKAMNGNSLKETLHKHRGSPDISITTLDTHYLSCYPPAAEYEMVANYILLYPAARERVDCSCHHH